jgi:hypothetical protein
MMAPLRMPTASEPSPAARAGRVRRCPPLRGESLQKADFRALPSLSSALPAISRCDHSIERQPERRGGEA